MAALQEVADLPARRGALGPRAAFRSLLVEGMFRIDGLIPLSYLSVVPGQPHRTGRRESSEVQTAHPGQPYTLHLLQDSNRPALPIDKSRGIEVLRSS